MEQTQRIGKGSSKLTATQAMVSDNGSIGTMIGENETFCCRIILSG